MLVKVMAPEALEILIGRHSNHKVKKSVLVPQHCSVKMDSKCYAGLGTNTKRKHKTPACEIQTHHIGGASEADAGASDRLAMG